MRFAQDFFVIVGLLATFGALAMIVTVSVVDLEPGIAELRNRAACFGGFL